MTQGVVDELEAVEVEEHDGVAERRGRSCIGDREVETFEEQLAVRQAGHLVVQRSLSQSLFQLLVGFTVVNGADDPQGRPIGRADR